MKRFFKILGLCFLVMASGCSTRTELGEVLSSELPDPEMAWVKEKTYHTQDCVFRLSSDDFLYLKTAQAKLDGAEKCKMCVTKERYRNVKKIPIEERTVARSRTVWVTYGAIYHTRSMSECHKLKSEFSKASRTSLDNALRSGFSKCHVCFNIEMYYRNKSTR